MNSEAEFPAHGKLDKKYQMNLDYAVKYGCKLPNTPPLLAEFQSLQSRCKVMEEALRKILNVSGGECCNYTSGIGYCYQNGKVEDAEYGENQVCNSCIAHKALTKEPKI